MLFKLDKKYSRAVAKSTWNRYSEATVTRGGVDLYDNRITSKKND